MSPAVWVKWLTAINWRKVLIFVVSILLFTLSLELMKAGARSLAPVISELLRVNGPTSGLGFGWLSAYLVMSGSPVAAAALTFFDVGILDYHSAFAMITGSRLGASLVILMIGFLYVLRGHERITSLTTGLLALTVTAATYLPALPVGYLLMDLTPLERLAGLQPPGALVSVFDMLFTPVVALVMTLLPDWMTFLVGLGIIVGSFNLFDRALPELNLQESAFSDITRLLYRPVVTFGLGLLVTLLTMSVSVSLGLLVPLSVRGYIRRENLVPYIMGCNISTFIDTLVAGLLLRNAGAAVIVLAQMLSVMVVSTVILLFFFGPFERGVLRLTTWLTDRQGRLLGFLALILIIPLMLLFVR